MKHLLPLSLCVLLCGCGALLPMKRSENASVRATEQIATKQKETLNKVVTGTPSPTRNEDQQIRVGGIGNKVDVQFPDPPPMPVNRTPYKEEVTYTSDAGANAGSTEDLTAAFSQKLPWGIALICVAIGILLLVYALKAARRASPAFDQGYQLGNELVSNWIREVREKSQATTDANESARLNAELAAMENGRARLAAAAQAKKKDLNLTK